jgi:hypothetical protein
MDAAKFKKKDLIAGFISSLFVQESLLFQRQGYFVAVIAYYQSIPGTHFCCAAFRTFQSPLVFALS